MNTLRNIIDQCVKEREGYKLVNNIWHKRRTSKELRLSAQIGEYDMDYVILNLGSDVNILPKKTWGVMGKPNMVWSLV